jgi:hypothetical protein
MSMRIRIATMTAVIVAAALNADAQWVNHPTAGLPRTKYGKPDLTAAAPHDRDGKPDLSGVWQAEAASIPELMKLLPGGENGLGEDIPSKYFINIFADYDRGQEPLRTAAAPAGPIGNPRDTPALQCLPSGLPLAVTLPSPFKIVQMPGLTMMLIEENSTFRQIFTDGRRHPSDPTPSWYGSSIGRWEGETFVVETIGLNDRSVLDAMGHTHSDALHVMERYRRVDAGHMNVQLTLDDPKTLTRPLMVNLRLVLRPDTDLIEYYCTENERDRQRILAGQ